MADSFNIHNYFKRGKTVVLTLRHGDEEIRQWTDKDISDLLKLMKISHPEFQNPRRRKKEVWDDVSNALRKSGYTWSSEDCRKKWSNMIRTLRGIEEQRNEPGYESKRMKWSFYDAMLQLLTLDNAEAFPEAAAVVKLLNNNPDNRPSGSGTFSRKSNTKPVDSFSKFTTHTQVQIETDSIQNSAQFLEPQRERDDMINLVSADDLMDMGLSLGGLSSDASGAGIDTNIIFNQPTRYKIQPDINIPSPAPETTNLHVAPKPGKAALAVRPRKKVKRKPPGKAKKGEESIDGIIVKFIENSSKQSEQMLEKMTCFHQSALALMRERNQLLREIRDGLEAPEESYVTNQLDNTNPQSALTIHASYSVNESNAHNGTSGGDTLTSPTFIITNPEDKSGSVLSSIQLEDGTVLGIDGASKSVLTNLGSFAQSVIPASLIHSGLVSVVAGNPDGSAEITEAIQDASGELIEKGDNSQEGQT